MNYSYRELTYICVQLLYPTRQYSYEEDSHTDSNRKRFAVPVTVGDQTVLLYFDTEPFFTCMEKVTR